MRGRGREDGTGYISEDTVMSGMSMYARLEFGNDAFCITMTG